MLLIRIATYVQAYNNCWQRDQNYLDQLTLIKIHSLGQGRDPDSPKHVATVYLNKTGFCVKEEVRNGFV